MPGWARKDSSRRGSPSRRRYRIAGGEGPLEWDGKGNLPVQNSSEDDEVQLAPVAVGIDAQEGAGVAPEKDLGLEGPAVRGGALEDPAASRVQWRLGGGPPVAEPPKAVRIV